MLKLLVHLRKYWKLVLLSPTCMMIEVGMDLLQPLLLAAIVDKGVANGDIPFIMRTGLLMVGIAIIGMAGGMGGIMASSFAAQGFGADLRWQLFKKVQSFSFANLDELRTASLITRLTNDVTQVQQTVMMLLRAFVRAPLLSIGGLVMAISINARLALILLVTMPLLALSLWVVINKAFPLFMEVQRRVDRVNAVMRENLVGVRVIKAFVRAAKEKERFGSANESLRDITTRASRVVALQMPLMMLLMNLSIVAIIWFGGIQVNTGQMTVGEVIAFINYITQILFALMLVAWVLMAFSRAKASADRINEVLDTEALIREKPDPVVSKINKGEIVFDRVSFQYPGAGGAPVLQDISFTVSPGETVAILGGTGAGKTSLVNLIPRFFDVTQGRVLVDGVDVRDYSLKTLREGIGMVPQETILFSGSIEDNIRWGKEDATGEEIEAAAKAAQIHDFIVNLPDGYQTRLGQRGINLSGGQKQRLAIARALVAKPAVLIFDDSTSAVDTGTEACLQQSVKDYLGRCTRIIIAQKISSVMRADKIILLENGKIEGIGTHEMLLAKSPVYQDIYHSQWGQEAVVSG
ncbi:MAG: ABC transporter ATP-binding protein [Clostridia bacterium]|jgi:ATP-binding cassette subfamily B multidrug efflux pump|nr:ABC transporter ATP-binding protein [Clostridia bacterium]